MSTELAIQFTAPPAADPAAADGDWLYLSQPPQPGRASTYDLDQMLARVLAGESARAYQAQSCPVRITGSEVIVTVDLHAWPSRLDLAYTLHPAYGAIGAGVQEDVEREFDLVVPMRDTVELERLLTGATLSWQTPCYDEYGSETTPPDWEITGGALTLSAPVFAVARVRGTARGYRHACEMPFTKDAATSITGVTNLVRGDWPGRATNPPTLELTLPDCAAELLALCPELPAVYGGDVVEGETRPVVYWSPCTGRVIELRYEPV